ncbi:PLP-dependent aminotransferase family protein [uncultured Tateyamaria sp.]|uniref:MocR-like pyridoxine biosynthesis transcription factor PdxR n=1 Tax=uncultured Tateyamaria sp. TaxID=455651 RepID=UPI00260E10F2|nr:PLP-dependent aminotransferase family protein [uncultured Tateyamaria sp.]
MSNITISSKANFQRALYGLSLESDQKSSLQAQLIEALRGIISSSPTVAGARLPASRVLAQELSISRTTVQAAYDQLTSEGIFIARQGSGTFVANEISHLATRPLSAKRAVARVEPQPIRSFQTGLPDHSLMPHKQWAGHLERAWNDPEPRLLATPDPLGWYPLREAIADHLDAWRGMICDPEQIVITSGAREAFELVFIGLLGGGRDVAVEDPCWPKMRSALSDTGSTAHPIRVGPEGLDAHSIPACATAIVVSPSRHYPTGTSLPLSRRAALLDWARKENGLVLEDDYDSEFRYRGQPLPSLSGLDGLRHTVYLGSFSKLISPSLRIGYLVVPLESLAVVRSYLHRVSARASLVPQPALASFMHSGEFAIHLRRMRRIYGARQKHLLAELAPVSDLLDLQADPSGMHLCTPLTAKLSQAASDIEISTAAKSGKLQVEALSSFSVLPDPPEGLLLGYAAFNEAALSHAASGLMDILWSFSRNGMQ